MWVLTFPLAVLSLISSVNAGASRLLVGLRPSPEATKQLEELFWNVADPSHSEYTQHRTHAELSEIMAADTDAVNKASKWLESLGCGSIEMSGTGDSINCEWTNGSTPPSVPSDLKDVVEFVILTTPEAKETPVAPVLSLSTADRMLQVLGSDMDVESQRDAYGIPKDLAGTHPDNLQMVWGAGTFGYTEKDLSMFYDAYCPDCDISTVGFDTDNKWTGVTGANYIEGMLDVSYISGMTRTTPTIVANTNTSATTETGSGFGAALVAFLVDLNSRQSSYETHYSGGGAKLPLVLSMSLGSLAYESCELLCKTVASNGDASLEQCQTYMQTQYQVCMFESQEQQQRIHLEFQKLGLRGTTLLGSSGDGGSHFSFRPFQDEPSALADALNKVACEQFNMPVFPTASPFVLSVGGTSWKTEGRGRSCSPDAPCGWSGGGGGFSWQFDAPYQAATSAAYLASVKQSQFSSMNADGTYNPSGRAYPDVSALAAPGIPLCANGKCFTAGGTSASAPTFAGLMSLINDHRLHTGLRPMGFVNVKLYQLMQDAGVREECFVDIGVEEVEADWECSSYSTCVGCDTGFPAIAGWDAQTGFGQPQWAGLLKHLGSD